MLTEYKIVYAGGEGEIVEKKSRFIATVVPVSYTHLHSILDDIPGVGPARRKDLMKYFADITAIKNATVEELEKLPSMNKKSAEDVYNFFH